MDRRTILRQLLWGIPAGVFLPSLISSCKDEPFLEGDLFTGKVIIIGAGASGVYAAHLLLKNGADVTILEASGKTGGRIQANTTFADIPIESGAEVIHGKRSVLYDLASFQAAERLLENTGNDFYWLSNQLRSKNYLLESAELNGEGAALFQIIDSYGSYPGSEMFLDQYLANIPLDSRLLAIANALTGNDYGSSNDRIGMLALKEAEAGYSSGMDAFSFKTGTYWSLFETAFGDAISKVILNAPVASVDYSGSQIIVKTDSGTQYTADRVLITVPLTILQDNDIAFTPALPNAKQQSITGIGMGNGIKITLSFSAPFWDAGTGSILGGLKAPEYWVSSEGKQTSGNYLTAFIMGAAADAFLQQPEAQSIQGLISELAAFYPAGGVQGKFTGQYFLKNWASEPFIRGAYSFPSINSAGLREALAAPVDKKLFFAGEATNYNGHLATVHGAMETGYRAAKEILEA